MASFKELLTTKRFFPLFVAQFLGAFNDNIYKNALIILITYVLADQLGFNPQLIVTCAAGLFIFPFFIFSATAGKIADRFDKAFLIRIIKIAEIFLMLIGALGFYMESLGLLFLVLFGLGMQSAFFGPLKYAILPDHLEKNQLVTGNALIEAGTFIAILIGTILGGLLILESYGKETVMIFTLFCAVLGWYASCHIPKTPAAEPDIHLRWNIFADTWDIMRSVYGKERLFLCILGISWFWFIGAMFLAQFPVIVLNIIAGDEHIVTLFLTMFSLGIAIGSVLCQRILKGKIEATWVPVGIVGITIFLIDLVIGLRMLPAIAESSDLIGFKAYFSSLTHWWILIDLLAIAICGGIYVVPLYALLQYHSPKTHRSRMIACNNIFNALFMVASALLTLILYSIHLDVVHVLMVVAILNGVVALYTIRLLPEIIIKHTLRMILKPLYRVEVRGLQHFHDAGDHVLILPNHSSMLDALFIAVFLPGKLTFTIHNQQAKRWWIKWALHLVKAFTLDPANPMSLKALINRMREETMKVVIFPEGRITVTGSLMKMYEGPGMIADKTQARLLPVYIDGAIFTPFTRVKGAMPSRWFPKITITIQPPQKVELDPSIHGRKRRHHLGMLMDDVMKHAMYASTNHELHLLEGLIQSAKNYGRNHPIIEDIKRIPMSYVQMIFRMHLLKKGLQETLKYERHVGILLPTSMAMVILFFTIQWLKLVPAMLNMASGKKALEQACTIAQIKTIITSQEFIEKGRLEWVIDFCREAGIRLIYLEELRKSIPWYQLIPSYLKAHRLCIRCCPSPFEAWSADDPAVILFTSGSEGAPKGVVLSHKNLMANALQLRTAVDFSVKDVVFNVLPLFHAFGLSAATLLPILSGVKVFLYPSPLHYRIIPELVYDTQATIFFGTDTFLAGYGRFAHPYDFRSLRYIFSGAEKLKQHTHDLWVERFGHRILEGYGATETSPVIAVATAMFQKPHSVGRMLPDIEYRIEPIANISDAGELWVKGPNVMLGYMKIDQPGILLPPEDGWYDTGDIVQLDEEGFLTIVGRKKRFAKIGGEMVSLTSLEEALSNIWPDYHHAVLAVSDKKKGEKVLVISDCKHATKEELIAYLKEHGFSELIFPKSLEYQRVLPLLATGKINYPKLQEEWESDEG